MASYYNALRGTGTDAGKKVLLTPKRLEETTRANKAISKLREIEKETAERNLVRMKVPNGLSGDETNMWYKANGYTPLDPSQYEKKIKSDPKVKVLYKEYEKHFGYENTPEYKNATAYGKTKIRNAHKESKKNYEKVANEKAKELKEQGYFKTSGVVKLGKAFYD